MGNKIKIASYAKKATEKEPFINAKDCHFIKINEISYDNDYPRREALENIFTALSNNLDYSIVYLMRGSGDKISLYFGVVRNHRVPKVKHFHAYDLGTILRETLIGNFQGSSVEDITTEQEIYSEIIAPIMQVKRSSVITGFPSIDQSYEDKGLIFQGVDRMVNSMNNCTGDWHLMIIAEPISLKNIKLEQKALYDLYNKFAPQAKQSSQESLANNIGISKTKNVGTSDSKGKTSGSNSSGTNSSNSTNDGLSVGSSEGSSQTESTTLEYVKKDIQELLKYLDEHLIPHLGQGIAKGYFSSTVYALSENRLTQERLISSINSVYQGEKSNFNPLKSIELDGNISDEDKEKALLHFLPLEKAEEVSDFPIIFANSKRDKNKRELSTDLTSVSLSLFCGLPVKEVPGIQIREGVDFGLSPKLPENSEDCIRLGNVLHRGYKLEKQEIAIDKEMLSRHIFIAGVTGSGKTVTCRKLLRESKLPFMIIEPAKTEYRSLLNQDKDMIVYTLGNEQLAPFRFNPFELLPTEQLNTHIDLLKAAFTAAFPMEAAMPYLLEEAMYEAYEAYGWNIDGWDCAENANYNNQDPWNCGGKYWPTMDDLLEKVKVVVDSKGFDQRLKSDYEASLIARFKNLCVGSKGKMLNCKQSVKIEDLLDKKVILELDDLKSPEDKSFMMGLIIARLAEAIKHRHKQDQTFKHITLMEEAHRLLEMPGMAEDGPKKHAVGMFTDLLAEVRKYGESLVIVDQIPNKLAPEVMKNTNTKIVHKLFAKDDREAIGDTIGLDTEQKEYLSSLRTGEAIIYSGTWSKAVFAKIAMLEQEDDRDDLKLEEDVKKRGFKQLFNNKEIYYPELIGENIKEQDFKEYMSDKIKVMNVLLRLTKQTIKDDLKESKDTNTMIGIIPADNWIKNLKNELITKQCNKANITLIFKAILSMISFEKNELLGSSKESFKQWGEYIAGEKGSFNEYGWENKDEKKQKYEIEKKDDDRIGKAKKEEQEQNENDDKKAEKEKREKVERDKWKNKWEYIKEILTVIFIK